MTTRPARIVLIGYGPVGARLVEGLLPSVVDGTVDLTVLGAEEQDAYNRVLVGEYAVGRATRERLEVTDTDGARAAGVAIRTGEAATFIDRMTQTVLTSSGDRIRYDRLVLATGSRPNVPRLAGLEQVGRTPSARPSSPHGLDHGVRAKPQGVVTLRDLHDADAVQEVVRGQGRIVVLGAGVLGMEIAMAACDEGARVTVLHHGETPMAGTLDRDGGLMLARAARQAGADVLPHSVAEAVSLRQTGEGAAFRGVICQDGSFVEGDLLLISCGVRPRAELAQNAGLDVEFGILVEPDLHAWADPAIFAIGDCAQVAPAGSRDEHGRVGGAPAGLIAPGWRQAEALAARLAAEAAGAYGGSRAVEASRPAVVMVKAKGVDVVAGGQVEADPWEALHSGREVAQWLNPARGCYVRAVTEDGTLTGFVAVGAPRAGAELTLLFERQAEVPHDLGALLRLDSEPSGVSHVDPDAPEATVCVCNAVTVQAVTDAIAGGVDTVERVGRATRAGTGCGGCRSRLGALLESAGAAQAPVGVATTDPCPVAGAA